MLLAVGHSVPFTLLGWLVDPTYRSIGPTLSQHRSINGRSICPLGVECLPKISSDGSLDYFFPNSLTRR